MLLNKNGVLLPVATKRQNLEAEVGDKGRKFYSMLNDLGKWGTPHVKPHVFHRTQIKRIFSKTKTKGSFQSTIPQSLRQLLRSNPDSLLCSQLLSGFIPAPPGCMLSRHHHWPCDFLVCDIPCSWARECVCTLGRQDRDRDERDRERDCLLEVMGHVVMSQHPWGGQATVPSSTGSEQQATKKQDCGPGTF